MAKLSKTSLLLAIIWWLGVIVTKLDKILAEMQVANAKPDHPSNDGLLNVMQNWCNNQAANDDAVQIYTPPKAETPVELPNEPDWSKAPDWAEWWAVDLDGIAYWFNNPPYCGDKDAIVWCRSGEYDTYEIDGRICDGEYPNWRNSLHQRPKVETITAQLNTDIDGYLAGKKSFISAYVDLLLARMSKEERFSDDKNKVSKGNLQPFDIVEYTTAQNKRWLAVVVKDLDSRTELSHVVKFEESSYTIGTIDASTNFGNIRTITELEAVEFRRAMEAVYDN